MTAALIPDEPGWFTGFPLPKRDHAERLTEINRSLGYETKEPEETDKGWIVRWRPTEEEKR